RSLPGCGTRPGSLAAQGAGYKNELTSCGPRCESPRPQPQGTLTKVRHACTDRLTGRRAAATRKLTGHCGWWAFAGSTAVTKSSRPCSLCRLRGTALAHALT